MFGLSVRVAARAVRATPAASLKLRPAISSPSFSIARRGLCAGGDMEVPIPELGAESIVEGGVLSIAKSVGDYVAAEEMVAEIETGAHILPHRTRKKLAESPPRLSLATTNPLSHPVCFFPAVCWR